MENFYKIEFYNKNKQIIHPLIKSDPITKPLWRKLFWTTGRNSDEYKSGCVDIFIKYFPSKFFKLQKDYK